MWLWADGSGGSGALTAPEFCLELTSIAVRTPVDMMLHMDIKYLRNL